MSAEKLINASVAISMDAPSGDERMFCHSIMSQIGLPRTQVQGREFHHSFGAAWLSIQAGLLDEGTGPVLQPVPYGATARLPGTAEPPVVVQVASAMNFSAEVQRLAGCLWPSHPHTVTAYCLRHQWGADAKRNGDADAVSRGLGHVSRKTQRVYGTASQGKPAHRLKPLRIEAERPVEGTAPEVAPTDPDEPESAS